MSHPDWMGQQPERAYWADDSTNIYYRLKRPGNELRDWYEHGINSTDATIVKMVDHHKIGRSNAVYSQDGKYSAYVFSGDVFVKNLGNNSLTQITRTAGAESSPQFLTNGQLAYQVGDNYFAWDLAKQRASQLVEIKMAKKPTGVESPDSYIAKEQHKLIGFVALEHKNAKDSENYKKQLKDANTAIFNQTWYLGKDNNLVASSLSPNGRWLLVALQEDVSWREKGDIMPNYITQDGSIAAKKARRRIADSKPAKQQIMLLDLNNHTQHELAFDTLPGWDEDVLASVKTENFKREGKTYESKPAARDISLMDSSLIEWSANGDKLAMMLAAFDNKDRWIATVDFANKKLVSKHRLHDDAWVNYAFNEFGWFNNSDNLYYVSEESGFAHLYVIGENGKTKQLTSGNWEVSSTTLATDDQHIYFSANKKHPGIYEAYRVDTQSGNVTQLTDLDGRNNYTLSPDGKKLLVMHSEIAMPPEVYIKTIGSSTKAKRLTHTVSQEFLSYNWNTPAIVPIKSSESVDPIFTKVYYPQDYKKGPKRKAAVFIHGAGYTQNSHTGWAYYFREFMFNSMLTQQGYVVLDLDYRASKGYGRDWRTWIYRNMGTPELQDMKDGVQWAVDNANVDAKRVGVYGGSYGGFMTLMSLFKAPDLFQAGAAIRLVSDWAYYNNGYTSNILNNPNDDSIAYERSSPIYFADGLKNALLINAPMVDDNVFFQDTVRLVQRMIELEKENFETAIYPVEPHGFRQASSWLDEYRRIYKLFESNL
ncbi:MAG: prolyl oligopeptidase family serine peptidase [Psychrosphaera sp.]|nr:prolyl oligopeptidase family serine peptidase [Psychrosphaera sp.]